MEKNVCIVHFNTPELTRAAVLSLRKHTPDCRITVFDNSDKRPFVPMEGVEIIDNTEGQVIDFKEFLSNYPDRQYSHANYGSAKHCRTIDWMFGHFPEGFVLMDSDVLIRMDISKFFDENVAYVGQVYCNPRKQNKRIPRLYPFLCWLNVPMCREHDIRYFDGNRCWELSCGPGRYYDTGASFYEDVVSNALPSHEVKLSEYIEHFGRGSHGGKDPTEWLEQHKNLYV